MAEYRTTLSLSDAYSLDEPLLQDIFERAKAFLELSVDIEFADVHKLHSNSLEDLLKDSLIRTDVITQIEIRGENYQAEPTRRFHFRATTRGFLPTCSLELSGAQDPCRALSSHVEGLLKAKRQWYSLMVLKDSASSIAAIIICALLLSAIPPAITWIFQPSIALIVLIIEFMGFWIWIVPLNWLRLILFPKLIVEIGRSGEIGVRARGIQRFVFSGIFATLILGVTASVIANFLSKSH